MNKAIVTGTTIYDVNKNITRIEYHSDGGFEIQAMWDENDEQTPEKQKEFREWADRFIEQAGYTLK
jgi:hypothetical protein